MTTVGHANHHTCPWWLMYLLDHRVRALIQPTDPVIAPFTSPGDACLDMGCGMGYLTVPLARRVGPTGHVTAVDLQPQMLAGAARRLARAGLADRVSLRLATESDWASSQRYDFAVAFWMLHEVQDRADLLSTLRNALKRKGRLLLVEPKIHVGDRLWTKELALAAAAGFHVVETPSVRFSRAVLLQ